MNATEGRRARLRHLRTSFPLAWRILIASALLAVIVTAVFGALLVAVGRLKDATDQEAHAKEITAATLGIEKLVVDMDRGLNTFAYTGNDRFLLPWGSARQEMPQRLREFERLTDPATTQGQIARRLTSDIRSYVRDYAEPLVLIAQESPAAARSGDATREGKRRVDEIRNRASRFLAAENARAASSAQVAGEHADRAIVIGITGLTISAALIVLFGIFLARSVARPVRGVALGATRLAEGDLSLRLGEGGPGEIGELTRAFNAMAEELERGHSELAEQNARLRESERLKSELVSIVSHEVRTPLASVLGFTALLLNREHDEETRRRYLEIIDAQGRRLASLLDDFLDVQRLEEGRLELVPVPVDLGALLREQVQLFSALSERHHLEIQIGDQLFVRGDPNRLAQVVGNLLSNAIKYSPEGGLVRVYGQRHGDGVQVTVTDEGLGIPEEQQERIFTKFFRGDAATSGIAGSGLGLAFARAVVEAHGGQMSFSSAAGSGSSFSLELPAAGQAA